MPDLVRWLRDRTAPILALCVALLAVRAFSDVALAAKPPDPATLDAIGRFLGAYEVVLPFVLLAALLLHFRLHGSRRKYAAWILVVVLVAVSLGVWPDGLVPGTSAMRQAAFPWLATAAAAAGSLLSAVEAPPPRELRRHWWGAAYVALLVLVPAVLAMRLAALAGVGTAPGPGGVLRGNWALVHVPTLALELFAVGVWMYVALAVPRGGLRGRWTVLLPFAAVPVAALAFATLPLTATIASAMISGGPNLTVFVPPAVSLTLAVLALACYGSAFLSVPRKQNPAAWWLLLLGTLTILLAGFFPSMASVVGLVLGLVTCGRALSAWSRGTA